MKKSMNFFQTISIALNPFKFDLLVSKKPKDVLHFYFSVVFLSLIIMFLIAMPNLINSDEYVSDKLGEFNKFSIDIDIATIHPVKIPKNPAIIVDTTGDENVPKTKVYVTGSKIIFKPFRSLRSIDYSMFTDVIENKQEFSSFINLLFMMMFPMIFLALYIFFALKFLVILIAASLVAWVICRAVRFDILFREILKISAYASVLMILIDVINFIYHSNTFYVQYIVFLVYFVLAIIHVGEFASPNPRKRTRHREYAVLEKANTK